MIKARHLLSFILLFAVGLLLYSTQQSHSANCPSNRWWCSGLTGALWEEFNDGDLDLGYGFSIGSVGIGGNPGDEGYEGGWGIR